jgi:hypothetical protein
MKPNEGPIGRIIRGVGGAILLALAAFSLEGPTAIIEGGIALAAGFIGAVTALTGLISVRPVIPQSCVECTEWAANRGRAIVRLP